MTEFKKYKCKVCGHIYNEEKGEPESGLKPGTLWADVPGDWVCPECGAIKKMFAEV
ncbi:MAG: rubredoxin [Methylococcales bacterium]|nr:rubredoxin [Methylococcales bacterium]